MGRHTVIDATRPLDRALIAGACMVLAWGVVITVCDLLEAGIEVFVDLNPLIGATLKVSLAVVGLWQSYRYSSEVYWAQKIRIAQTVDN